MFSNFKNLRELSYTLPNIKVPFVPPKPKEFERAILIRVFCALWGTKLRSHPSLGWSKLIVGGAIWSRRARIQKIASTEPAEPNKWPVIDLVELTANS